MHAEASSVCAVVAWSWLAVLRDALDASLRLVPPDPLSAVPRVTLHQGGGGWRRMSIAAFSGELHWRQKPNVAAGSGGRFSLVRLSRTLDRPQLVIVAVAASQWGGGTLAAVWPA